METIRLSELLKDIAECQDERMVCGISDHSKEIQKNWVFVLRRVRGRRASQYAAQAIAQGGIVVCDQAIEGEAIYHCDDIERYVPILINRFYGDLSASLCVIGVTGTSGKTSVASLVTQLLQLGHHKVMQIGTLFLTYEGVEETTVNTTPGCFQLAMYFHKAILHSIPYVVMEVSSHAIDQERINFIRFDMLLYTNITQDHLDYHITKTHYRYTKFKLRKYLKKQGVILYNNDFPYMQELVHIIQYQGLCFGTKEAHFPIRDMELSDHHIAFTLQGYRYEAKLLGMMNVYNVCEALVAIHRLGSSYELLQQHVQQLETIAGRMEMIQGKGYSIWLDYAHTSDALKQLLQFASEVKKGRVITVIGCGGDRDRSKRPQMAEIAATFSDLAVFTSDNPRFEHTYDILADMQPTKYKNIHIFENRYFALKHVVKIAQNSDIIIIAGKGNEAYISVFGEQYPFSDRDTINDLLSKEET